MSLDKFTLDKIHKTFEMLPAWDDRFRFLIDLGKKLPPLPEDLKRDEFLVKGCMSKVWLIIKRNDDGGIEFLADSDAHIVKGLVALLLIIYSGKTAEEIGEIDLESIFKKLELENHLSINRRNGFFSMVETIRSLAKN